MPLPFLVLNYCSEDLLIQVRAVNLKASHPSVWDFSQAQAADLMSKKGIPITAQKTIAYTQEATQARTRITVPTTAIILFTFLLLFHHLRLSSGEIANDSGDKNYRC